jgi:DMSO/TMAO reductase YedYZ molybdopterin-dependent catalytic subunit
VVAGPHLNDRATLIALRLAGEPLALDHGFPARLIAPNRPGVLQTKWVSRITVWQPR